MIRIVRVNADAAVGGLTAAQRSEARNDLESLDELLDQGATLLAINLDSCDGAAYIYYTLRSAS